jgi:hypothetical protein
MPINDMTEPKRWPNLAEWARMDAISASNRAINNLNLAKPHISDSQALRYISEAIEECYKAKIALIEARGEREEKNHDESSDNNRSPEP